MGWNQELRKAMRESRIEKGISVMEMATLVGRDHRTLRRIEAGDVEPRAEIVDMWFKVCKLKPTVTLTTEKK
jgi:DNA-binding XRE family transcriptional regulator